jgi:phenylalanyl-tRNA synthetase alpha chain
MPDSPVDVSAIETLRADFRARLSSAATDRDLKTLTDEFLSRKAGAVTALLKTLGAMPAEARREYGQLVNALKTEIETALDEKRAVVAASRPPVGAVDVTLPGRETPLGRIHPLMRVRQQVEDIFTRLGYEILEGPEVEEDYYNFEALNMPPDHPARDMQDTLYLGVPIVGGTWGAHRRLPEAQVRAATLLRTHTSAMQIRYMQTFAPPVRIIVPGRVYRRDNLDLTHTPMFQQFEGLVVGEGVTMADLKGTLQAMVHELFGADVRLRLRPSFFPYTEPSAEVDISCRACGGSGCGVCKHTGWLEILGSGMVHPAVLEAVGYDPERYTGFAFGTGMERMAMLKYGVDDIRLFYENDLRFLEQFPV